MRQEGRSAPTGPREGTLLPAGRAAAAGPQPSPGPGLASEGMPGVGVNSCEGLELHRQRAGSQGNGPVPKPQATLAAPFPDWDGKGKVGFRREPVLLTWVFACRVF